MSFIGSIKSMPDNSTRKLKPTLHPFLEEEEELERQYEMGLERLVNCIISARLSFYYEDHKNLVFNKDAYETALLDVSTQLFKYTGEEKSPKIIESELFLQFITTIDRITIDRMLLDKKPEELDSYQIERDSSTLNTILKQRIGAKIQSLENINKGINVICDFYRKVSKEGLKMVQIKLNSKDNKTRIKSFAQLDEEIAIKNFSENYDENVERLKKLSLSNPPPKRDIKSEGSILSEEPKWSKELEKHAKGIGAKRIGAKRIGGKKKKTMRKRKQRKYKTRK